jgi:hypothetical protein
MLDRTMVRKGSLLFTLAAATWLLAASCERSDELRPGVPALPDGGKDFDVFPSGTPASELRRNERRSRRRNVKRGRRLGRDVRHGRRLARFRCCGWRGGLREP